MKFKQFKHFLKKNTSIYNILLVTRAIIMAFYYKFFMLLFRVFPINSKKIIVTSYFGKGYGDQAKYILEELKKDNYEIYWATKPKFKKSLPNFIRYTKYNSINYLFNLATAKIWINNSRFPYGIIKRDKQFYIQTWHSSLRLKKIEKDAEDSLQKDYIMSCKKDSKMINVIISGSKFSSNIYKKSFWYDGDILEVGTPRCDIFFNEEEKNKIKENVYDFYKIDKNKKIILYAPTFRNNTDEKKCYLNCYNFSEKLSDDYILFVRFHPVSKYTINNTDKIINVTDYSDMQQLLIACNLLITDYSGCCFDALINNTNCILYTPDIEEYLSKERSLYFDINNLPFGHALTEDELLNQIINFNPDKYKENTDKFKSEIGLCEKGISTKEIAKLINDVTK